MNKWQAIVAVVQSFNDQNRPGLALAAAMFLSLPLFGIVAAFLSLLR